MKKRNHTINWYLDGVTYELVKTLQKNGSGFSDRTNRIYKIMPKERNIVWEEKGKEITQQQIDCISEQGIRIFKKGNSSITMKAGMAFHERDRGESDPEKIHYLKHTFASAFELKGESVERKNFYSSDICYRNPESSGILKEYMEECEQVFIQMMDCLKDNGLEDAIHILAKAIITGRKSTGNNHQI